jgi:hypothetical protein
VFGGPLSGTALLGKEAPSTFIHVVEDLSPQTIEAFLLHRVYRDSYRELPLNENLVSWVDST